MFIRLVYALVCPIFVISFAEQITQKNIIFPASSLTVYSVMLWYHSLNRLTFQFQFCSLLPK